MDITTVVMFSLGGAILAALVWIAVRLRPTTTSPTGDSLESTVKLLKAELIANQTESLLALRQSIDAANQIINERLAEGTTSLGNRV